MTTASSLINIPDLAVDIILKNVDFKAIFSLRKVCRPLRNYIDKRKPEVHINHIEFSMTPDHNITVKLECNIEKERETREIVYSKDPLASFQRDFKIIMSHWKSQFLNTLQVDLECKNPDSTDINQKFIDSIRNTFLDRPNNQRLGVINLDLHVTNEREVMQLLPFVDPGTLNVLSLMKTGDLDLTEIRETDQFKRALRLNIGGELTDLEQIGRLIERTHVNVFSVHTILWQELNGVLMLFRDHDHIQELTVGFHDFPDLNLLVDQFGEGREVGDDSKWLVSFVNMEIYIELKLSFDRISRFSFSRFLPDLEEGDEGEFDEEDEDDE